VKEPVIFYPPALATLPDGGVISRSVGRFLLEEKTRFAVRLLKVCTIKSNLSSKKWKIFHLWITAGPGAVTSVLLEAG
jgi:hypothetical protein